MPPHYESSSWRQHGHDHRAGAALRRDAGSVKEVAERVRKSEAEIAATLIEGALAADEIERDIIRDRLAKANAGGSFARHEAVLAWLETLSEGKDTPAPKITATF